MSETLVLIGGDTPSAPMVWARVAGDGALLERGVAGQTRAPSQTPQRTVLIIPAADARLRRLVLPARSQAQARAGAAALFEQTMSGGETLTFAVGADQDGAGARLVAAIDTGRLGQWLESASAYGVNPHTVLLDCSVWPTEAGAITIAMLPQRAIVAGGALGGFSIEPPLLAPLLARWIADAGVQSARIIVEGGDAQALASSLQRTVEARSLPDPVATIAEAAASAADWAPNLRQGEFAASGSGAAQPFRLWRFAALLAVAAVMLQVLSLGVNGWRDHQAAAQVLADAERDFRAARPDISRIVNLRTQVRAEANAIEQAARHPVLLTAPPLIEALRRNPATRLDEVRHEMPQRSVRLIVSAPRPEDLSAFAEGLREQGVAFTSRDSPPRDGRYAAELTLEAP